MLAVGFRAREVEQIQHRRNHLHSMECLQRLILRTSSFPVFVSDPFSWFETRLLHPGAPCARMKLTRLFHPRQPVGGSVQLSVLKLPWHTSAALRGAESSLSTVGRAALPSPASALQGPVTHNGRWDEHKDFLMLFSSCNCE